MSQTNLFSSELVHFGPTRSPGLPVRQRVALCGVTFALASSDPEITALGSSNLEHVTCPVCLEMARE